MSPENFTNPNNNSQPEVSGDALKMQRPGQVTLSHLLHEITDKTKDGIDHEDGSISADLGYPGQHLGVATVFRIEKGTSRDDPNRVGQIHRREGVGDNGDRITNYFISDTPDGLHMEKHSQTSNPRESLDDRATPEELQAALSGLAKIAEELQKAHAVEDKLGLSFVSEQEARELIGLLGQLGPFE